MKAIARGTLMAFLDRSAAHGDAREPTMAWYRQVRAADRATPADVKPDIRAASIPKNGRAVFNRKRPLTLGMIRRLHAGLGNPAESLLKTGQGRVA